MTCMFILGYVNVQAVFCYSYTTDINSKKYICAKLIIKKEKEIIHILIL